MIYLDYAANTPVDKEILDLYYDTVLKYYSNPNSIHKLGKESKELIDNCTNEIANILNVLPEEIIYTSGATESNNLAIKGIAKRYKNRGKHIVLSPFEHNSIIASATALQQEGFEISILEVNKDGLIDLENLKKTIREDTILVSITSLDSEIGIKQPIAEIAKLLKEYPNIIFHTDASQAIGKRDNDFKDVDLITIAPHKFYGLNGIGLLIKKKNISLIQQIDGGKSTTIYRSGTPNLPMINTLPLTLKKALTEYKNSLDSVTKFYNRIIDSLKEYKTIHINSTKYSTPYIVNFSVEEAKGTKLMDLLSEKEVYVSTKTSCCPEMTPSKLVYALTKNKNLASTTIRLSLSHLTTDEEVEEFLKIFAECYKEL